MCFHLLSITSRHIDNITLNILARLYIKQTHHTVERLALLLLLSHFNYVRLFEAL